MKTFFIIISLILIWSASLNAQVIVTCAYDSAAVRSKPTVESKAFKRLGLGTKVTAIAINNDFYKIVFKSDTGYVYNGHIKMVEKLKSLPDERPKAVTNTYYSDDTISGATAKYGPEDDRSEFKSGDYDSITLVWHCALGKYRSLTYVFKEGHYQKESEYTSDCLR
jgi:hypothetical protein